MDDLPNLIRAGLAQLVAKLSEPDCNVSELARLSGVASKTLYRIRDGENTPNVETIEKVLRAFQVVESGGQEEKAAEPHSRLAPQPEPEPVEAHPQAERGEDRRQTSTPEMLGVVGLGRTFGRRESDAHEGPTQPRER